MRANILQTIEKKIRAERFNFENVMRKRTYFGKRCNIDPAFCSYGQMVWRINTDFGEIIYDYELKRINITYFDR